MNKRFLVMILFLVACGHADGPTETARTSESLIDDAGCTTQTSDPAVMLEFVTSVFSGLCTAIGNCCFGTDAATAWDEAACEAAIGPTSHTAHSFAELNSTVP